MGRGQIAMEFITLLFVGMILLFVILTSLTSLSGQQTDENTLKDIEVMGKQLQQEFLTANDVEDGYNRNIFLPVKLNGRNYNVTTGNSTPYRGYLIIEFDNREFFYFIPVVQGNLSHGSNTILKENGSIYIK